MNLTGDTVLIAICIAISGWTLLAVIDLKSEMAAVIQRLRDLPCNGSKCPDKKK